MQSPRWIHAFVRPGVASLLAVLFVTGSLATASARAGDSAWPREFDSSSGSFVVYKPQPQNLSGDLLEGRAVFSLTKRGDATPTLGVLWYTERVAINRAKGTVTARSFDVTKVRLPGITSDEVARYEVLLEDDAADWNLSSSLEDLQADLAAAEKERANVAGLNNAPPRILYQDRRAILVVYDGRPELQPIEGTNLQRVANTPYAVVFDPRSRNYYLNGANLWYRAKDPLGPWASISNPPAAIREIVPPDTASYDRVDGPPPEVLTATEPTELIATDGTPRYAPLVDDDLLYIANTESDVIFEVETQSLYVLISGRWFRAPSLDGPWAFVRGDQLPESFARVPLDSPKGHILASVAGTDQADEAIANAEIPQGTAIQRGDGTFQATYDGEPEFAPIEGTDLQYAVNTEAEVILADGRYYACDQGVWYIADDPEGPWYVSDTRPVGVEDIPPSCPVYDVRYVYIYDSTPEVVYVGYLPGYLGCYSYHGTVVYGTGYRYGTWRTRNHYFPRRFTWGFHARYNPWLTRWSFGFSYGSGFLRVGTRWRSHHGFAQNTARSKWFGPGGFRRPLVAPDMTLLRTRRAERTRPRTWSGLLANVYNRATATRVDRGVQPNTQTVERSRVQPIARPVVQPVPPPVRPRSDVREPEVRQPAPIRNNPPEQPTPPSERERPIPPRERPAPPPERPAPPPEEATPPPPERPAPPPERPSPRPERPERSDDEREHRDRRRADREDSSEKEKHEKERPSQRVEKNMGRDRNR